ncbi:MAG: hypothetical protein JW955_02980 [Sedimentisphaerales bacterium]|nr:hypothetical protein [Sedimentisphaerales bacterium]
MELTWINKLRIALVAALGAIVIGILAWPLAAPTDPLQPVRAWSISLSGTVVLLFLAFGVGFAGYFIAWPHGREIGILGVPFGLTIWAGRSGPMQALTQAVHKPDQREALLHSLRFEPVYWLLIVAAGFAGVLAAQRLYGGSRPAQSLAQIRSRLNPGVYLNGAISLLVSTVLIAFLTGVTAQDLCTSYEMVAAQPATGQIIFAMLASFAAAAFVAKRFLGMGYLWSALAALLVWPFADLVYGNSQTVTRFAQTQPATSFPHAIFAVLPLQCVAVGALGAVAGYWLAVRYEYWRRHESAG